MIKMNDLTDDYKKSESDEQRKDRTRSDMISKKMGELLLLGYKMLNDTCDECDCILMQKKNQPKYCISCEDPDLQKFNQSFRKNNNADSVKMSQDDSIPVTSSNLINKPVNGHGEYHNGQTISMNTATVAANPIDALRGKINWATIELLNSNSVRYNTELCEMIKAASEAIISLRKIEI